MRAMSTDSTVRGLPEFKARRSTPPTVVNSFAQQLDAQRALTPPRGVQRLSTRPSVTPARRDRTVAAAMPEPSDRALRTGGTRAKATAGRPAGLALVAPRAEAGPTRAGIVSQAKRLLDVPYVWGGDKASGLDCSAYVSRAWGVPRQTTDTLQTVADPVDKKELKAGDAVNLPTWKDPSGHGHVRLFDRWADQARTRMWVYEETAETGKSVHRVIDYDDRYQPMRLRGLD